MYKEPIFLKPVFQERIWGGQKLNTEFGYDIPYKHTGEAWVISAHPNGPSEIVNGELKGKSLIEAWENHGELFGKAKGHSGEYPLLIKILDAADDLSVQVHPNDEYAREVENQPYGKTECWYVLQAEEGAEIIFGHHASTKEEFQQMVDAGEWDKLLRKVPVQAGDFVYVPSGTIHAIGKGIVILETQQSSDITYRVYDYDRTDDQGNTRELHLDSAIAVSTVPHQPVEVDQEVSYYGGLTSKRVVKEQYFTVYHWDLDGEAEMDMEHDFLQVSVVDGQGWLTVDGNVHEVQKGDHFIVPNGVKEYHFSGQLECLVSHP
ncbi:mannose-6-phosphate isomerase, class I [Radiobacillus kanasensis]|uniref:mannose-6-phosphate isomerase, class I n=1 Tax=Radiobacillus kanasensis TaxID=2844358 RepID=UPI001E3EF1A3|nr:mannose-6-phosphate isomerase, class I [Radiobacillus kanasensis]UFT99385.1 mannose-6-phosphate isomerase, class I [Radiobacillus kanasensis]